MSCVARSGFVSVDGGYSGGEFTTPPLLTAGGELRLNCDGGAGGWLQVEVQDVGCRPLAGWTIADADAVTGNAVEKRVSWGGGERKLLGEATEPGRAVRLRFVMRDIKLYAFQICEP